MDIKNIGFEIIDFHIHPFLTDEQNTCFYETGIKKTEQIKADLLRCGIKKACGSVIERINPKSFDEVKRLNDAAFKLEEMLEGFYVPGVHIHPNFPKESCEELERAYKRGVRLVGELVPYYMGWDEYYDKNLQIIYECIQRLGMTVCVHTQSEESLEKAVSSFKEINFVAAHPQTKDVFLRHIERMKKYENYYLDLSGTGIFRYGLIKYGVNSVGSERFLFGTDYPICNPGMYVHAVLYENLTDKDYENIFYGNAKRLLKNLLLPTN